MSAQHTPGPWFLGDWGHIRSVCGRICTVAPKEGAANVANARLIAAAPLLLQELRGASTQMEMAAECIEAGRYDEALLHVRSMSRLRRAAIAEATGETP